MKIHTLLAFLFLMPRMMAAQNSIINTHYRSLEEMLPTFENPSSDFRPTPLWVWHDRLDKKMLARDLQHFKESGLGGGFMHPRYGLITEYLSDEWFEMVEFSVQEAKRLGLKAWIYDENSFPSGFAGGWVPELMPESAHQPVALTMARAQSVPVGDFGVILREKDEAYIDVTAVVQPGDSGDFILFENHYFEKSKWYAGRTYVDLLIPGVTEQFIDVTMPGYERSVGDEFGATVPGVFTDEPNINPDVRGGMRTTPALFEDFHKRWGYDLKVHLPSIFAPVGEWKKVRHNYYELLLELFIDHWSKPWHRYTEEKNLAWTGHYWEHGWPNPVHGSDNMAMYAYHQIPAVDMLFNTADHDRTQFGNIRAIKEVRSVANQFSRARVLSETYGAAGWELTFKDMKRNGDWEYVLGINFMNQHLAYMNLTGDRKHDFPQGICYQTPWWKDYRVLNDYFARLSVALSSGEQMNDILVLEPTTTAWMYYSPVKSPDQLTIMDAAFHNLLSELEDYQVEYDLGSEKTIKDFGAVKNGRLLMNDRSYRAVVLPPHYENFNARTFELLRQFLAEGGSVYNFGEMPTHVDGRVEEKTAALQHHMQWKKIKSVAKFVEQMDREFKLANPLKVGGDLYHMRRDLENGQLVFLTNFSLQAAAKGSFSVLGASVQELDALSGAIRAYPTKSINGYVEISFDLPPAGSLLLYISDAEMPATTAPFKPQYKVMATGPSTVERLSPNILTLDYINLTVDAQEYNGIYYYTGGLHIWKAHGYEENPWVSSVQWQTEWVEADTFVQGSGFDASYPFIVDKGVAMSSLRAVVENPDLWQVRINGQAIKPMPNEWAVDETWGVFDISEHVVVGQNELSISMHPMSIYAEIAPAYILGNFQLAEQERGWKIVPAATLECGSWREQGHPFYPYDVRYSKKLVLTEAKSVLVRLGEWRGTVASVHVNGVKIGIIGWQPFELDVSDAMRKGENRIDVVVTGSLKNLLGPHHNVSRRGVVTPWSFKYAPEEQPRGRDYDLLDYGLLEDFEIAVE
ncbi:hypothetical protein JXA02_11985 [candidate division KSB1 bacterium]|nr:hypothetical protein [candidate division KSB1 bacterium]RQW01898.1 MAG: hypothetical protein EH222_14325 [candidate division KSB1 bacterium]